jgi:hypothetical protein
MISAPCKDCPDRTPDCHSECREYNLYRKARRDENKLRQQDSAHLEYMKVRKDRILRRIKNHSRS